MGFLDAFVYAHHQHRRIVENPGNFGDYIKGRIRSMTAITLAYAHAYQATCLARHMLAILHQHFRLPKLKERYPYLHVQEEPTSEDGLFLQTEVLASLMVKLLLDGV